MKSDLKKKSSDNKQKVKDKWGKTTTTTRMIPQNLWQGYHGNIGYHLTLWYFI